MDRRRASKLVLSALLIGAIAPTAGNATPPRNVVTIDDYEYGFQGEGTARIGELDARPGQLAPTAAQRRAARQVADTVRWNKFGTPKVVFDVDGYVSPARAGAAEEVARAWIREHAGLFRLSPEQTSAANLQLVSSTPLRDGPDNRRILARQQPRTAKVPHVVLFRQRFGALTAANDGLISIGLDPQNRIAFVSSSLTGDTGVAGAWSLTPAQAWARAAADVKFPYAGKALELVTAKDHVGFSRFRLPGVADPQLVRKVALPTPRNGVRLVYEVDVLETMPQRDAQPTAFISFVDAQTGKVWLRFNRVDHFAGSGTKVQPQTGGEGTPHWKTFSNAPELPVPGEAAEDSRELWCWVTGSGCTRVIGETGGIREQASPFAYDELVDPVTETGVPTTTTQGNNAWTTASYISHLTPDTPVYATSRPLRDYNYAFTDQWHTSNCKLIENEASPARNDKDASITNLFMGHNRMHDWAYFLGFTESTWNMQQHNFGEDAPGSETAKDQDPEKGQAQAGALAGSVAFTGRDNANQVTLQDGTPGVTNQYLWHPLQAGFYAHCTDGAYDQMIIAHEYGHAISNRMIGGPDAGIGGNEGGSMGESWSDLMAVEYVYGYGFPIPAGAHPFSMAPYATGSPFTGIRNYNFTVSPLNYSNLGYDGNGATSPHADGEIWSVTQTDVRSALMAKYESQFPTGNKPLQFQCADGLKPVDECPGNRRWIQIMFDAFLLGPAAPSMIDQRDAQLAADKMRFAGANQKELWGAFARRGMGQGAEAGGTIAWSSPVHSDEATVRFQAVPVQGGGVPDEMFVYLGHYEARASETAISAAGALSDPVKILPGTYDFIAKGDGYGAIRFRRTFAPGQTVTVQVPARRNHASVSHEAEADGDGGNFESLIDDTEDTNWAFLGADTSETIEGKGVTVALGGGRQLVDVVNVSAANRPQATGDAYDTLGQSRFAALRSFEILTCDETKGADCSDPESFTKIYTSPADAFRTGRPRPLAPNLKVKEFDVPNTYATHVRIRVLTNQCTGNPIYSGEQNPVGEALSNPDCQEGYTAATLVTTDPQNAPPTINNTQKHRVRISELQVFSASAAAVLGGAAPAPTRPRPNPGPLPATGGSPLPIVAGLVLAGTAAALIRRHRTA